MDALPPYVYAYADKLRPGGDQAAGIVGINHYLRSSERAPDCAALVLPLLPAALAAAPSAERPEWLGKALARLGRAAVPLVIGLARSPHQTLREAAAVAVAELGPDGAAAAESVALLMTDAAPAVRVAACRALAATRPDRDTVRLLVGRAADADDDVVHAAISSLREMAEHPGAADALRSSVPALLANIDPDSDPGRRLASLRALAWIGVPVADRKRLLHFLRRDWSGQAADDLAASLEMESALAALKTMGPAARDCSPDLERLLTAPGLFAGRVAEAAGTLLAINPSHPAAAAALHRLAASADANERAYAAAELGDGGPVLRSRLRDLVKRLEADPDEDVRDAVMPIDSD